MSTGSTISVSLDEIELFLYNLNHDTNDIIRDFKKSLPVMTVFFSDVIVHHKDMREEILLLIYLVLYMKTRLNVLDKSLEKAVFNTLTHQSGGALDEATYLFLKKELPIAFDSIYYEYAEYKLNYMNALLQGRSVTYLDELLRPPVLSNSTEIVPVKNLTYFTAYYQFYGKIIKYIRDYVSIIEDEFRQNDISQRIRYYVYRRILELDVKNKEMVKKTDILRDKIGEYETGGKILNMLYGNHIEDRLINNIVDGLRTKVTTTTPIFLNMVDRLTSIKNKISSSKKDEISYFSKTFNRLTNRVTDLTKYKQFGGLFIQTEKTPESKEYRYHINKILYSILRTADSIHDFLIGSRTSPEFKKIDFLKSIKFLVKKEKEKKSNFFMNYSEIIDDIIDTKIFGKKFKYEDNEDNEDYEDSNINLLELARTLEGRSNFENNIIDRLNHFIYKISKLDKTIGDELLEIYRPGNTVLESILIDPKTVMNTAQYVKKDALFELEETGEGDDIFTTDIGNLMFVIYDSSILNINPETRTKRLEILKKIKRFLGLESVFLSVDFYSASSTFFKMCTVDNLEQYKNVFVRPGRVLAEIWDPATNKTVSGLTVIPMLQTIGTDLLDKEHNIPICAEDYEVKLEEKNDHVFAKTKLNINQLGQQKPIIYSELDIENEDRTKRFNPEVRKISKLMTTTQNELELCKLLYLKNSGDWGQVTSAKENKTFLLTEDKLCSYYSVLTNTSTIYTIKRGDRFLTMLHKGNINMKWDESIKQIVEWLKFTNYYLFTEEIRVEFVVVDKSKNTYKYNISFMLDESNNIVFNKSEQDFLELNEITTLKLSVLDLIETITKKIKRKDKTNLTTAHIEIKSPNVNKDVSITIIEKLSNYMTKRLTDLRENFLSGTKQQQEQHKELEQNYERSIYIDYYNKYYIKILTKPVDYTGTRNQTHINEYVKNRVIDYLEQNITLAYLLLLKNSKEHNTKLESFYDYALISYFRSIYTQIIYTDKHLIWKNYEQYIPLSYNEYESNLQKLIETKKEKQNIILVLPFGSKKYKEYRIKDSKTIYRMEYYRYALVKDIPVKSEYVPHVLFLSSLTTNGLWDLFTINPFIYSLFAEYLKLNYDKIPKIEDPVVAKKLFLFYSSINIDVLQRIQDENLQKIIQFVTKESIKYYCNDSTCIQKKSNIKDTATQKYIETITNMNLYDFELFYYLYKIALNNKIDCKIVFKKIDNTVDNANMSIARTNELVSGISDFTFETYFKVNKPYVGEYLEMLSKITMPNENTELISLIENTDTPVEKYFSAILESNNLSINVDTYITEYVEYLNGLIQKDVDYYSTIMGTLKTIKINLEQNSNYLDVSDNKLSIINWFIFMVSNYLDDYDKLMETIYTFNKKEFCLLTKSLLEKIKDNIGEIIPLQYIKKLLEEAIKREVTQTDDLSALPIEESRFDRIVEINTNYPAPKYDELDENQEISYIETASATAASATAATAANSSSLIDVKAANLPNNGKNAVNYSSSKYAANNNTGVVSSSEETSIEASASASSSNAINCLESDLEMEQFKQNCLDINANSELTAKNIIKELEKKGYTEKYLNKIQKKFNKPGLCTLYNMVFGQ